MTRLVQRETNYFRFCVDYFRGNFVKNVGEIINELLVRPDDVIFGLPRILRMQHPRTFYAINVIKAASRMIAVIRDDIDIDGLKLDIAIANGFVHVCKSDWQLCEGAGGHV